MNIYELMEKEILNLKMETRKIYKPVLILSLLDYYKDLGLEEYTFNNFTSVELMLPFYRIYLENDELQPIVYGDKSNGFTDKKILNNMRTNPLRHLPPSPFFKNDDPKVLDANGRFKRGRKYLPNNLMISINEEFDNQKMIATIRKACYQKIYNATGIKISESIVDILKQEDSYKTSYGRVGQSLYRSRLKEKFNCTCALCSINFESMLIASHAKPWRDCESVHEKLSASNGLLLCANHDKLFDRGFITIDPVTQEVLFSKVLDEVQVEYSRASISPKLNVSFDQTTIKYLTYHKDHIFQES